MKNLIISADSLGNIQLCPRLYMYSSMMRYEELNKPTYMERGSLLHHMLACYYTQKMEKRPIDIPAVVESARKYALDPSLSMRTEEVEDIIKLFGEYIEHYKNEDWEIDAVEAAFAVSVYENEKDDIRIISQGKYDLLVTTRQGLKCVVDHKKVSRNESNPSPRDTQILNYCFTSGRRDFMYNWIGEQKTLKVSERMSRPYFCISEHHIEEFKESLIFWGYEIIKHADLNMWPPNYKSCKRNMSKCKFHDVCQTTPDNRQNKLETEFKIKDHVLFPVEKPPIITPLPEEEK